MAKFTLNSLSECTLNLDIEELKLVLDSLLTAGHSISGQSQEPDLVRREETEEYQLCLELYKQIFRVGLVDEDYNKIFEKELDL